MRPTGRQPGKDLNKPDRGRFRLHARLQCVLGKHNLLIDTRKEVSDKVSSTTDVLSSAITNAAVSEQQIYVRCVCSSVLGQSQVIRPDWFN